MNALAPDGDSWTVVTLKEYMERRFDGQEKAVAAALAAAEKAVSAALAAAEKAREQAQADSREWRASANEWRGSMVDREVRFAPRAEMESELKAIRSELQGLKETRASNAGSSAERRTVIDTGRANIALAVAIIGGLVGFASLAFLAARFFGGR